MATGPKKIENRGGARPGAGRKLHVIGERLKNRLLKEMKRYEKECGVSLEHRLMDYAHGKIRGATHRESLAAMKIMYDLLVARASESNVNVKHSTAPAVYLPAEKPDPAKIALVK